MKIILEVGFYIVYVFIHTECPNLFLFLETGVVKKVPDYSLVILEYPEDSNK